MAKKPAPPKLIETYKHEGERRPNIPTAEFESVVREDDRQPVQVKYPRNTDLDPQLVWRGKDEQDWSDLVVNAPPLYIQEKVHPKVLIDSLRSQTDTRAAQTEFSLFEDFNGVTKGADKSEFYQHDQNWTNRMILGDSLQVMASLAEREKLRGKVQCIYFDPPYGIKFNSNFQWSTTSRDVKDGKGDHITREPEQVKAFRDTWRDGIHSYLTYLRDRLTVARDLLTDSGSIFVQIGDENVHRVRAVLDEVFGEENCVATITFKKTGGQSSAQIAAVSDYILFFAKDVRNCKSRPLFALKSPGDEGATNYSWIEEVNRSRRPLTSSEKAGESPIPEGARIMQPYPMFSDGPSARDIPFVWRGTSYSPSSNAHWKTHADGLKKVERSDRFVAQGKTLRFVNYLDDYSVTPLINLWTDTQISGFGSDRIYVVQTLPKVIERCILMVTDPGDLVLDPTCGSGTTATVAEQWGRRWITIDTSRVALALARARIMGARYPFYLLADSKEGQLKEAEVTRTAPSSRPVYGNIRHGFVYERVPHITLKSIANNAEIDVIWDKWQEILEPLRGKFSNAFGRNFEEWEMPREADPKWQPDLAKIHADWWKARIARQKEIDASIAAKAEFEYL
jgi:adenine-specific DNA-methyltransferase